jgi:hypothetical protein
MRRRCRDERRREFPRYGGRGITVCKRWRESFAAFLEDMGECPPGKTLDRFPDNDGDYCKANCRWATRKEQRANQTDPQRRDFCKRGHALDFGNTAIHRLKDGHIRRSCRTCAAKRQQSYIARSSMQAPAALKQS